MRTIDIDRVQQYRLTRVRDQMAQLGLGACVLSDPINIRYATGSRNMQVFCARNTPSRYLLLTESDSILYEFTGCAHLAAGLTTITEIRRARTASFVAAGPGIAEQERQWARELGSTIRGLVGPGARVGMERMNAGAALALAAEGFHIADAQQPVELARSIKSSEEVQCIRASLEATQSAVAHMASSLRPGLTENELWSLMHQRVIASGGDYFETRLLSSGSHTNPWFQETGHKVIGANELVALDTDVVGCCGYYSDFSRTFHSGPDRPTGKQRTLYKTAREQIEHNMSLLRPGLSFREYSELAWEIPDEYVANRYYLSAHGCGMTGEYPYLYHRLDYPAAGYDGVVQSGMVICVESYIGLEGDSQGVKLEQQCLVTPTGIEVLSSYPFDPHLDS